MVSSFSIPISVNLDWFSNLLFEISDWMVFFKVYHFVKKTNLSKGWIKILPRGQAYAFNNKTYRHLGSSWTSKEIDCVN
jgi:hypothetical protein